MGKAMGEKFIPENRGEGNRDSARRYHQAARKHTESGASPDAGERPRHDIEGPEADKLRDAERKGKRRIAEDDPAIEAFLDENNRNVVPGID
jgi:hypothetical protein